MNLIIVESPTKARTLSRFLGKDYSVEATMGHLKDLPKSELGIDVKKNFKPNYVPIPTKEETAKLLQKLSKKASKVYLATDPDREGEAISFHVKEILDTDGKIKRITFHEITKEAVEEAIKSPRDIDKHLVNAQIGRRVLDRLVGYKLSPLLWRKVRRGLSAGRVQTVTVRLIVEREREIEKFKAEEYWEIWAQVSKVGKVSQVSKAFTIQLVKVGEKKAEVKDKKTADGILGDLKKAAYKVASVDKHEVRKNPYAPFTTSTMTQAGARLFFWSAKKTMRTAQRLYEEGLITYHRTDSTNIAASAISKVRDYIKKEFGDNYLPEAPRIYKTKSKLAQEAHEAIRPTNVGSMTNAKLQMPNDEKKLYDLIWRRFVASQMTPSVYDETTIDVEASFTRGVISVDTPRVYVLRASGQVMKFDGWRKLFPIGPTSGVGLDSPEVSVLPDVKKEENLDLIKVESFQKFTEPLPRFNEASLIKTLEKLGIGRPSTYAPTISTIQIRSYVEKKEGKFYPTPVGLAVNDFLLEYFPDIFDYQFTAEMEGDLDSVAEGKIEWESPIKKFWSPFEKTLEIVQKGSKRVKIEVEKLGKKCPKCKEGLRPKGPQGPVGELVIRIGRFGKFVSCSRFPDCDFTEKYVEKIGMKCPKCKSLRPKGPPARWGDVVVKKSGKGRNFFGCSRYPDCKWASWKNPKPRKEEKEVATK